jgi:hypothetical protein
MARTSVFTVASLRLLLVGTPLLAAPIDNISKPPLGDAFRAIANYYVNGYSEANVQRQRSSAVSPPAAEGLTNDEVIKMVKAGLSEEIIIAAIDSATKKAFDTRAGGLVALKAAGVSDRIILTMQGRTEPAAIGARPTPVPAGHRKLSAGDGGFEDPQDDGIYVVHEGELTTVEPTVARASGVGPGSLAMNKLSLGFKRVQAKAHIGGAAAELRITNTPEFYFYGQDFNPNKFLLLHLEVGNGERKVVVGEAGGFAGVKSGVREQDVVDVDVTRLRPGAYKVVPRGGLGNGEYGFVNQGNRDDNQVYEFGVD